MIHDSILGTIGRTPVVRLNRVAPANVELYAKAEAFNPGGSVKDRLAIAIILDAEARGQLKPGDTVIERSEEHTSELQTLRRSSYAVFCLEKTKNEHTKK